MRLRGVAFTLLLAALAAIGAAQDRFSEETTVVVVEVPVHVLRDGQPVRGLTRDDFELFDGRKKQQILDFEVIDLSQLSREEIESSETAMIPTMSVAGRRHFLMLFDLSLSDPESILRARGAAKQIIAESLHPADLVGVATYTESQGLKLILGFTGNRDQAEYAIDTLGIADPADRIQDPLGLVIAHLEGTGQTPSEGGGGGRSGLDRDAVALETVREMSALSGTVARDQQKNRVLALASSMQTVAELMNSVQGAKNVVFLSEGFDSDILTGVQDEKRQEEINRQIAMGQSHLIDSRELYGDSQASSGLEVMIDAFRRADCTIQAVNIAGLDTSAKLTRNEGLFRMAHGTGGELYGNFNQVADAMQQVLDRTSVTYLLSFQPRDLELDGKFHKLRVEVKDQPRGTQVVSRPGYYPPKPFEAQNPLERQLSTAGMVLGGGAGGALDTAALAAPFVAPGESYVPVLVEVSGDSLLAGESGDTLVAEVYAYAFDEDGAVADFFTRRMGFDLAQSEAALRQAGLKYWGHMDLEPGKYVVRVLVRNLNTGNSGLSVVPITVPDFAGAEPALLPPFFPEPQGKWVLGRETEDEQRQNVPFPFMMGESPFIPAAQPMLRSVGSRASLVGYNLGPGSMAVSGELLTLDGTPVDGGARVDLVDREDSGATSRLTVDIQPGSKLAAGRYVLVLTVLNQATGQSRASSTEVDFEG